MALKGDREVSFRFYTGSLKPSKVLVRIFDDPKNRHEYHDIECQSRGLVSWKAEAVKVPKSKEGFQYTYVVYLKPTSDWKVVKTFKEKMYSRVPNFESLNRSFPADIDTANDIFEPPTHVKFELLSISLGVINSLQKILDNVKTIDDLKKKLYELEHTYRAITHELTNDPNVQSKLRSWIEKALGSYYYYPHKVVLLSALYGRLAKQLNASLSSACDMTTHAKKHILPALENIEANELTKWSLMGIRETVLQALEFNNYNHWMYVAAKFAHLFDLPRVMDLRKTMTDARLDINAVEKVLIPKIINGYPKEEANVILHELPKSVKTKDQRVKLQELVQLHITKTADANDEAVKACKHEDNASKNDRGNVSGTKTQTRPSEQKKNDSHRLVLKYPPSSSPNNHSEVSERDIREEQRDNETFIMKENEGVFFQVLVRAKDVTSVEVSIRSSQNEVNRHRMKTRTLKTKAFPDHTWVLAETQLPLPFGEEFTYNYEMSSSTWIGKNPTIIDQTYRHSRSPNKVFDIFNEPYSDIQYQVNSQASIVYAEMLLEKVTKDNLLEVIMVIDDIRFPGFWRGSEYFLTSTSTWIQDMIFPCGDSFSRLNSSQLKYLSVLFGKLKRNNCFKPELISSQTVQMLIQTMRTAVQSDFPTASREDLKFVCEWLVLAVNGTWIHAWLDFHNLFDIRTLKIMQFNTSPSWTIQTVEEDLRELELVMNKLKDKPDLLKELVIGCVHDMHDTRVLKQLMVKVSTYPNINADGKITESALDVFEGMIKKRWVYKIYKLDEVWQDMRSTNLIEMTNLVRRYYVKCLTRGNWPERYHETISRAIRCPKLYPSAADLKMVIKAMLDQPSFTKRYTFLVHIIQDSEIIVLASPQDVHDMLETALQSLASSSRVTRSMMERVYGNIYRILQAARQCESIKGREHIQKHIDNVGYGIVRGLPIDYLLDLLASNKKKSDLKPEELDIVAEHTVKRLREESKTTLNVDNLVHVVKTLKGTNDQLCVSSRSTCTVIQAMVDLQPDLVSLTTVQGDKGSHKFEASMLKIIRNAEFWIMVFNVTGQFKAQIQDYPKVKTILHYMECFLSMITNDNLTIIFVRKTLKKHAKSVTELLTTILPHEVTVNGHVEQSLSTILENDKLLQQQLRNIGRFFKCVEHLAKTITIQDAKNLVRKHRQLQKSESDGTVTIKECLCQDWWGTLFPLIPHADKIQQCADSEIFLNICRSVVEGTCTDVVNINGEDPLADVESDSSDSEDTSSDGLDPTQETSMSETAGTIALKEVLDKRPIVTLDVAQLMIEVCRPTFDKHCSTLFDSKLDMTVRFAKNMTDGINQTGQLEIQLNRIQTMFNRRVPQEMKKALKHLVELPDLSQRSCQLRSMLRTFGVTGDEEETETDQVSHAIRKLTDTNFKDTMTLHEMHVALKTVSVIEGDFEKEDWEIIEQLANAKGLVTLLEPLVDEDLRNLIDAVEERSEQHVNESTVSDLIDVKRYMEALLRVEAPNRTPKLIKAIKTNRSLAEKIKGLPAKIDSCASNVHSLRVLYNNVANRGEMTKEIIRNTLEKGDYQFILDEQSDGCHVQLTYSHEGNEKAKYGLTDLNDFRSRALLMVHTKKQLVKQPQIVDESTEFSAFPDPDYEQFIASVDAINEIIDLCTWLRQSGHFSFQNFEESAHDLADLQNLMTRLKRMFSHWQDVLNEARTAYYFLNFFHSKQLWELDQFFQSSSEFSDDLLLLFRFVNPLIEIDDTIRSIYETPPDKNDLKARLFHLGKALETIFSQYPPSSRKIPGETKGGKSTLDSKVHKGRIFVADLDENSTKSIPVLLQLYRNTTNMIPEPNQVIFCNAETSWEEISLLLQRCVGAPIHLTTEKLFALVNVNQLDTETQFSLVREIQKIQETKKDYLIAMICCGGRLHHIIDQFVNFTHRIQGYSDAEMSSCLRLGWPKVQVVTSERPGLGKTEYVRDKACERGMGVSTLHISGPIVKKDLVQQMRKQRPSKYDILHIDAASVSDPSLLDTFIFETVVIGMSVTGTFMCMGPTTPVIVEVANTYHDKLRNSLAISSCFSRKHLEWEGFDNFIVSQDINSPVQVVCNYLKALSSDQLDKNNIELTGDNPIKPLNTTECHSILDTYCGSHSGVSYTTVNTFLAIFAQELRRMSASLYFTTQNLKDMIGSGSKDVRRNFVKSLLEVSKDFTTPSVKQHSTDGVSGSAALLEYKAEGEISASKLVERIRGMVRWQDSNHLLVVFHRQDSQTISILYRLLSKVPSNIKTLFEFQMKRHLEDYNSFSQSDLHKILEKVCRSSRAPFDMAKLGDLATTYALTPDNLLKMVLIHMRIKSRVPVIIMGETGCGKTTLITYLARVCEVPFEPLNLHAGVSEQDVVTFVTSLRDQANNNLKQEVWGFLDEINTCDHLGILNEVICHHSLKGEPLPDNLVFIAACNPYRLRENDIVSTGLDKKHQQDEMSKLVYRVHPLPETMMDYVWDYGSLDKKDEKSYIGRMLGESSSVFVDLVVMSQEFIRNVSKTAYCVSLRDVHRCQHLQKWFVEMLGIKGIATAQEASSRNTYMENHEVRGMILAIAHCYHSRLTNSEDRKRYRQEVASILSKSQNIKEADIETIIRLEQLDFLNRMQLPDGTAKNEALRENVFVILVSILNRIPVFVVGKPGCSKSLSMQLIRSNLRGQDSKEVYFKKLPSLYVVSYQGSESSTSIGIIKVFEKAKNYKKPGVMPVVLLDEIGLAEVSRFNPLKVLHSQLEPTVGSFPSVAVVGISNWSLDAAKMNRAIHLSRPEPTVKDLADTAQSIRDDSALKSGGSLVHNVITDDSLFNLAKAYSEYQQKQKHSNFHGLRDYYSLVKYVAIQSSAELYAEPSEIMESGILRNFGGLKLEMAHIMNSFTSEIGVTQKPDKRPGTIQLIEDNIQDKHARHLMLITSGDSALNILENTLQGKEHVTKFGSRFENDISEEYNYRILSEIILCMERGVILVLRDLENIYGSLYDMLNQNYLIVGKKRNCRVALGPYSNPFSNVHPDFRCIVLVDEKNVDYQNPPFLNRFEKQTLRFSDILTDDQIETINHLYRWIDDICCVDGYQFSVEDMFLGWHADTLSSLVYLRSKDNDLPSDATPEDLAYRCQRDLMKVACPDAVLRASKSKLHKENRVAVEEFQREYFNIPLQQGLKHFFEYRIESLQDSLNEEESQNEATEESAPAESLCSRTVVYTRSSVHTDIASSLEDIVPIQVEKLSKFKSERQFASKIHNFWFESDAQLLVVQCTTSHDAAQMLLAKSRIDEYRNEYLKTSTANSMIKHVFIIVHIDRIEKDEREVFPWQFNFLCGWDQYTLDSLEPCDPPLEELLTGRVSEHLDTTVDLNKLIKDHLLWCFSCIKYEGEARDVDVALDLVRDITQSSEFIGCLKNKILAYIREAERTNVAPPSNRWQVKVATDVGLLYQCSTLSGALIEYIGKCVREPLAKCVILLEQYGAWSGSPCNKTDANTTAFWQTCFHNPDVFNISRKDIPEPRGPESCLADANFLELKFPFFKVFHDRIDANEEWLMHRHFADDGITLDTSIRSTSDQLADMIGRITEMQQENYLEEHVQDYIDDMYNNFSIMFAPTLSYQTRVEAMRWMMDHISLYNMSNCTKKRVTAVQHVALAYVIMWTHKGLLSAELQLLAIYDEVTPRSPETLIEDVQKVIEGKDHTHVDDDATYLQENPEELETCTEAELNVQNPENVDAEGSNLAASSDNPGSGTATQVPVVSSTMVEEQDTPEQIRDSDSAKPDEKPNPPPTAESKDTQSMVDYVDDKEDHLISSEDPSVQNISLEPKENEDNEIFTPETILVNKICKDILPDKQVLKASKGIHGWQRKVSSVLLLAGRVSPDSTILHFLRLCRDVIAILSQDFNISEDQLSELSEMGKQTDDPLSNEDVLIFITSLVDSLRENVDQNKNSVLDYFLTSYFCLCLEANIDSPLLPNIIAKVCSNTGELVAGSRPLLLDIIQNDVKNEPVCEDLICSGALDEEDFPNLALLDDILTEQGPDSNLSTICCDVIEEVAFSKVTCAFVTEITSEDHSIWQILSKAVEIVGDKQQVHSSLQFTCAAALIRAFMKAVADLMSVTDPKHFQLNSKHFVLAKTLNGMLTPKKDGRRENNLSLPILYLLKCLRETKSLSALRALCTNLEDPITNLLKIKWQDTMFISRLPYCPLSYVDHYKDAIEAMAAWQTQQTKKPMEDFIEIAQSSPDHRIALLAAVSSAFYFIRSTRGITDVDRQAAEWIYESTTGFSEHYRGVLQRLLGLEDFTGILHISESTSQEDLEISSVIVHLVAIIVSNADQESMRTAFLACLDQSTSSSDMCFPGVGDELSVLELTNSTDPNFYDCVCGLRVAAKTTVEQCPLCLRARKGDHNENEETAAEKGKHEDKTSALKFTKSVRELTPVVFRVLDTMFHSCVLAGICTGFTKEEQIASFLISGTDSGTEISSVGVTSNHTNEIAVEDTDQNCSPPSSTSSSREYLRQKLVDNWRMLRVIIQANFENVTTFLHRVIRGCKHDIVARSCPLTDQDRAAMENALSNIINYEATSVPTSLMEQKIECLKSEGVDNNCLETRLEELDPVVQGSIPAESMEVADESIETGDTKSVHIQQVFRKRHQVSLRNFQAQFVNMCDTSKARYPFLRLCISRLDVIQYVRYLYDLLKWNSFIIQKLNHAITRDDARRTKVGDFLANDRYHGTKEAKEVASDTFKTFQKAWNKVRDGWSTLYGNEPLFDNMTKDVSLAECVVDTKDQNCHLRQVIGVLLQIQNSFLTDTLAIATNGHCPALVFLMKDKGMAGLKKAPLHTATGSIIHFEWSDKLLVYHDICTKYGYGGVIRYNYSVIERELARMLVLNKAFLVEGSGLTQFGYSDELFHACSVVLSEIKIKIPQIDLTNQLVNSIKREQSYRQTYAKDLLGHLDVILVLLKKTGGEDRSSLEDYIKRWAAQLPGAFPDNLLPEPRDGFKLQHVASLYETLEDLLVDSNVESLRSDYRKDLSEQAKEVLTQNLKPLTLDKLLETASVIKRFIFRYLRSDTNTSTSGNLQDLVERTAGDTMDCSLFIDILPGDLEVKHIVKLLEFIDKQGEQKKDANRKEHLQQPSRLPQTATGTSRQGPTRRRGGRQRVGLGGIS